MFILLKYCTKEKAVYITDSSSGAVWLTGNGEPEAQQVDTIHDGTAKAGCARVGEMWADLPCQCRVCGAELPLHVRAILIFIVTASTKRHRDGFL